MSRICVIENWIERWTDLDVWDYISRCPVQKVDLYGREAPDNEPDHGHYLSLPIGGQTGCVLKLSAWDFSKIVIRF
jgi:3'-phosphoadenosine 5'-phosphosulfate sulfotransferase (PAPS reductase)/FAD synthetase